MEIGESVAVELAPNQDPEECPFSHEVKEPTEKNELGGVGTKLASNMIAGTGVHTSKPPSGGDFTTGPATPDPRDDDVRYVNLTVNAQLVSLKGSPLPYPLTCAAHHLIPAQESLKGHAVLNYMCKQGENQDFLNGKATESKPVGGSKVWGNVAYNVNGCHNGAWLPGNYAVGGGAGGIGIWKSRASEVTSSSAVAQAWVNSLDLAQTSWQPEADDPENEAPQAASLAAALADALASADAAQYALAGTNFSITDKNPKWAYVKAAMDATGGQFHDRHGDYSKEVGDYLTKIATVYNSMHKKSLAGCDKCKKARDKLSKGGSLLGPPYPIVMRLNSCSKFFRGFVCTEELTASNIYTSKWVKHWIETKHPS